MLKTLFILATTVAMLAGPTLLARADDDDDSRETPDSWERQAARKDRENSGQEAQSTQEAPKGTARKESRADDDDD